MYVYTPPPSFYMFLLLSPLSFSSPLATAHLPLNRLHKWLLMLFFPEIDPMRKQVVQTKRHLLPCLKLQPKFFLFFDCNHMPHPRIIHILSSKRMLTPLNGSYFFDVSKSNKQPQITIEPDTFRIFAAVPKCYTHYPGVFMNYSKRYCTSWLFEQPQWPASGSSEDESQ